MADNSKVSTAALALLQANLGFYNSDIPSELSSYLNNLLEYAFDEFGNVGIPLQPGLLADDMDQATFAAWVYRNSPIGANKSEQLRSIILNRQVRQALEGEG